jgi:extradiol dioxygenase family protein
VADSPPFHLAFKVSDLQSTERFYGELLGCEVGRRSERWLDFDFFGHQLTAHVVAVGAGIPAQAVSQVDGDAVPVPHFGVVLTMERWRALAEHLRGAGASFVLEPHVRFEGQAGEQATFFICDPSGNAIEFKAFEDARLIFKSAK